MRYTLENGKTIVIPDTDLNKYMSSLDLTKEEAIKLWLTDNDYEEDEEQEALDSKAKKIKIDHDAKDISKPKQTRERTVKVSDEKQTLFNSILTNIDRCVGVERENVRILKENKLIEVKIGEKTFKIDVIETRIKK